MDITESKRDLHIIIEQIPDDSLEEARTMLRELLARRESQAPDRRMTPEEFQAYLDNAPEEDEEITEEEWRGIEEGRRAIREGSPGAGDMRVTFTEPALVILRSLGKPDRLLIGAEIRRFQDGMPLMPSSA